TVPSGRVSLPTTWTLMATHARTTSNAAASHGQGRCRSFSGMGASVTVRGAGVQRGRPCYPARMRTVDQCAPLRRRPRGLPVALCLVGLTAGCERADPVAEARHLQEEQRYGDSLEPLRALMNQGSPDPELQYLYGRALSRTGQYSLAEFALR